VVVVYKWRYIIAKNGVIKKKKYRVSVDFNLKKIKPKMPPILKEQELIKQLLEQKKKLEKIEAERKIRREQEEVLRRLEREKEKTAFECWCSNCKKIRTIKDPVFRIIESESTKLLAVYGKCIICERTTMHKVLRKATDEDIRQIEEKHVLPKIITSKQWQT